ncbi:cyclodeaminase [Thalassospira marina]|uniref:Ornithine cyclodeaminase family protein n=1 Tax=Thalassospira marina TaxID=2048283 RepID=A0A2N3KYZ6_9PROT|nr:cyclodeaminase [Thalassospira marina]PKR55696.1 ornithine cyclodeaminase family protein [Thalassospira marina]
MPTIRILTENDLRKVIALDLDAIDCVENAFLALATRDVRMPPILRLDIDDHNGEVDVKTAYVPGLDSFAIKISPGFFDNPKLGLPSVNGLMNLFSAKTGLLEAVLLDNGYLTDIRTAAAGGVAARHLARADTSHAAIFGTGVQARLQLTALTKIRPVKTATIWGRDIAKAEKTARDLSRDLGIAVAATDDGKSACENADIIVTTTPAREPIVQADWVAPGTHVTAMGSDAEHKNEIDPALFARADLYVCDNTAQCRILGELHHAIDAGLADAQSRQTELGQVIAGSAKGRSDARQITYCDLTGTGVQDTAIATLARQRCDASDAGTEIVS